MPCLLLSDTAVELESANEAIASLKAEILSITADR
jgi:hypothetical protein